VQADRRRSLSIDVRRESRFRLTQPDSVDRNLADVTAGGSPSQFLEPDELAPDGETTRAYLSSYGGHPGCRCGRSSGEPPAGDANAAASPADQEKRSSSGVSVRLSATSSSRSCGSNRGRLTCRRRIGQLIPGARGSPAPDRPERRAQPAPATGSARRPGMTQANGDVQQTGPPTLPRHHRPSRVIRPRFA
jgi:hypothetical protein